MSKFEFNNNTTRFDLLNALRLAESAQLAYDSEKQIEQFVAGAWGLSPPKFYDLLDTQAFMVFDEAIIILSFRGTEPTNLKDWLTDLKVKLMKSKIGQVHSGFAMALNRVWKKVENDIKEVRSNNQTLWVTGHSLGGALATIAVDRLTDNDYEVSGLYTFGQPRVGDAKFAENFDKKFKCRTFRFVNNEDIVTRVPPRAFGYKENGCVFYFDSFGNLCRGINFWREFLDLSVSTIIRSLDRFQELKEKFPNGFEDHAIERYINLIKKNLS